MVVGTPPSQFGSKRILQGVMKINEHIREALNEGEKPEFLKKEIVSMEFYKKLDKTGI